MLLQSRYLSLQQRYLPIPHPPPDSVALQQNERVNLHMTRLNYHNLGDLL
jgi:hypothetical protein